MKKNMVGNVRFNRKESLKQDLKDDNIVLWEERKKYYRETYLKSDYWKTRRKELLELAKYVCEICGEKKPLDIHHLNYDNLYNEPKGDLLVLCRICHEFYHKYGHFNFGKVFKEETSLTEIPFY